MKSKIERRHLLVLVVLQQHTLREIDRVKNVPGLSKWMAMKPMTIERFTEEYNKLAKKMFIKPIKYKSTTGEPMQAEVDRLWATVRKAGLLMPLPEGSPSGKRREMSKPILTPVGEELAIKLLQTSYEQWPILMLFEDGVEVQDVGEIRKRG